MKVVEFVDIEIDGINHGDAPDYCDTYIASATAVLEDGSMRDATEEELIDLNSDSELVYDLIIKRLF